MGSVAYQYEWGTGTPEVCVRPLRPFAVLYMLKAYVQALVACCEVGCR